MGEARKLQKKLRQIENLEIKISLTPEEKVKVLKKAEYRSRLAELLLQLSGPQQTLGFVGKEEDSMKRQIAELPEQHVEHLPALKIAREDEGSSKSQADGGGETAPPVAVSEEEQEDAEFKSRIQTWEKAKFRLRVLEGHSDIITCAVAVDNLVISGSRDTTVKVWHVPTATEQRNLGGHSGGITCLSAPPPEYCRRMARALDLPDKERFVLSQCVNSIYTFSAVSSMCFVPEGEGFVVTGSDAGKLQVWSWSSQQNCQALNAHLDAVTSLQSQGPLVFSASADGSVCVWEVSEQESAPLRRLQLWGSEVTGCAGQNEVNRRLILSPRGDRVFLSCGRSSIRVLNWRTGVMSRLSNHSNTAGVTDCVSQIPGLLMASCFDLASGESSLNLFSLPQCKYLVSLSSPELPRILCFSAWLTASGDHRWVTGGCDLIVWELLPGSFKKRGDVTVRRDLRLEECASESDSEDDSSEDSYCEDPKAKDASETEELASSSWLRCVLHFNSQHSGWVPLWSFLLVTVSFCAAAGNTDDKKWEEPGDMQLAVTAQASTTQLWAVDWGPTQPLEDETHHIIPSLESESLRSTTSEEWSQPQSTLVNQMQRPTTGEGEEMEEPDTEVDPQFYVTVTISSVLIFSAVIISAKLCYDRSLSHRPPPLSLGIHRAIAQEDKFQWSIFEELTPAGMKITSSCFGEYPNVQSQEDSNTRINGGRKLLCSSGLDIYPAVQCVHYFS
ncbi:hypothetical protein DNTS_028860 [Danionella cerebrum]|uniref:Uncharacterized protein n=1 Tax=Danionella cerebrum TaxID=2873325 RepID=A0A553Q4Y3_9TELE|nr:hypothetical protein DNTS_028860 [Danionella translucida]